MSKNDIDERVCELNGIYEGNRPLCDNKAEIIVHRHTEKEFLQEDGSWKKEAKDPDYYCRKHFEHIFLHHPFYSRIYRQFPGWENSEKYAVPLKLEPFTYSEYKVKKG